MKYQFVIKFKKIWLGVAIAGLLPLISSAQNIEKTYETIFTRTRNTNHNLTAKRDEVEQYLSRGDLATANKILVQALLIQEATSKLFLDDIKRPQSFEALYTAIHVIKQTLPAIDQYKSSLGALRTEKLKFSILDIIFQKFFRAYDVLDQPTYSTIVEDCRLGQCPPDEINADRFFGAYRNFWLSELQLTHELHSQFYNSRIELIFMKALLKNFVDSIQRSGFRESFLCLQSLAHHTIFYLENLDSVTRDLSPYQRSELVQGKIRKLENKLFSIKNQDTCNNL